MMTRLWYKLSLVVDDEQRRAKPTLELNAHDFFGVDTWSINEGKPIENWNPESSMRSKSASDDGEPYDIASNLWMLPVFSARLIAAVEKVIQPGEVQWLPVRIFRYTGRN